MAFQNEKKFSISVPGEFTGELWVGDFKTKILLSHSDDMRRDALRRELIGKTTPEHADPVASQKATVLADLSVRITESPGWWKEKGNGFLLEDVDVIVSVYNEAIKAETEHLLAVKKKAEESRAQLKKVEPQP